jgi:hypothetical protein
VKFPHPLTRPGRRTLATTTALAVAGLGLVVPATAAEAGTAPAASAAVHTALSKTFTIPAGQGDYTATVDGVHFSVNRGGIATPDITCTVTADAPSLVDGGVEGIAGLGCTAEVYELVVGVAVAYDSASGWVEESSTVNSEYDTTFIDALTNYAPAIAGDWETVAVGDAYWTSPTVYSQVGPAYSGVVYI